MSSNYGSTARTPSWIQRSTLFEEAEDCLAQSLLIFLYADLRLLSATGRIHTKFEALCIGSDRTGRSSAAELAGMTSEADPERAVVDLERSQDGISPVQIMAVLLLELRREVQVQKVARRMDRKNMLDVVEEETSLLTTIIESKGRKKMEDDMHALLTAYNDMIGEDIRSEIPRVTAWEVLKNPVAHIRREEMRRRESTIGEPPPEEGTTGKPSRFSSFHHSRSISHFMSAVGAPIQMQNMPGEGVAARQKFEDVGDALVKMATSGGRGGEHSGSIMDRDLNEKELLDLMERAVASRVDSELEFMADFFKMGTVSRVMARSMDRVVWLNDWYPIKDLIYAISVDLERKRVLCVFRGCSTHADWSHALDAKLKRVPNPILDTYPHKSTFVKFHSGFHRYLFRQRKDTGTSKYQEIATKLHEFGRKIGEEEYTLTVTGHSLGGALATIFGFYASTEERFTRNGPVRIFSYGSPYVGGYAFADAFRFQERMRRVQHARFENENDGVAHLPLNLSITKRGSKFRHVGMAIWLPRRRHPCCCLYNPKPHIKYEQDRGNISAYFNALKNSYFFHMPLPWRIRIVHGLNEHQKRLLAFRKESETHKDSLMKKSLDGIYEALLGEEMEKVNDGEDG